MDSNGNSYGEAVRRGLFISTRGLEPHHLSGWWALVAGKDQTPRCNDLATLLRIVRRTDYSVERGVAGSKFKLNR